MKIYFQKTIDSLSLSFTFHHLLSGQEFLSISIHPFLLSLPFPFRTPSSKPPEKGKKEGEGAEKGEKEGEGRGEGRE